ncbi:MAG: hypothetical protein HYT03_00015 [Candidatus Harrisonbacteria bacterium]|nr:hypothetical protein [Candidatus Harrisonbacteria bacterium]
MKEDDLKNLIQGLDKNTLDDLSGLRKHELRRQTIELLKTTRWGRIYAIAYLLIGIGSIFLYSLVFGFDVIFSIFLGIITWFAVSFTVDTILIKILPINKQLDWLLKTPEGFAELKKGGITDGQIEKLREDATEKQKLQELVIEALQEEKDLRELGDLCKCGHTYGSHPFLQRRTEGLPMPPAHSCISCKCKKFEINRASYAESSTK